MPTITMIIYPVIERIVIYRSRPYTYLYQNTIPAVPMVTFIIITYITHVPARCFGYFKGQTYIPPISSTLPIIIIQ